MFADGGYFTGPESFYEVPETPESKPNHDKQNKIKGKDKLTDKIILKIGKREIMPFFSEWLYL